MSMINFDDRTRQHRLILFCDDTNPEFVKQSNLTRMSRVITPITAEGVWQGCYYHNVYSSRRLRSGLQKLIARVDDNSHFMGSILDMYKFFSFNYIHGDELFCFGAARGAYVICALCDFILDVGLLQGTALSEFRKYFKMWRSSDPALEYEKRELVQNELLIDGEKIRIKVLGCFNVVAIPGFWKPEAQDGMMIYQNANHTRLEYAFHALAMHETNPCFYPVLWNFLPPSTECDPYSDSHFRQDWFRGSRFNVCGGARSSVLGGAKSSHEPNLLADIPLVWMLARVSEFLQLTRDELTSSPSTTHDLALKCPILSSSYRPIKIPWISYSGPVTAIQERERQKAAYGANPFKTSERLHWSVPYIPADKEYKIFLSGDFESS
ncbi:uncharacterized protein V1518DRAFT_419548 [Limtongia smithiae]|uniref:uncharacterized protein n=1 Tax=Limtongia smithiae TaxID=1125753 RepID=UPI0034CF677E